MAFLVSGGFAAADREGSRRGGGKEKVGTSVEFLPPSELSVKREVSAPKSSWTESLTWLLIGEVVLLAQDKWADRFDRYAVRHRVNWFGHNAQTVTAGGDYRWQLPALGLLYLAGGGHDRRTVEKAVEALVNTGLLTKALKVLVHRRRPPEYNPPTARESFPSGHASTAFALATVLGREYDQEPLAYTLATLVALSRVSLGRHHVTDVLAGALLGTWAGRRTLRGHPPVLQIRF